MEWSQLLKDFAEAISPAFQVLVQAIFVGLAAQVSAWMYKTYQLKKSELSASNQYLLELVVSRAVSAAKQLYDDNEQKKIYAISVVESQLVGIGLNIDLDVIVSAIEAEVNNAKPVYITDQG